MVRVWITSEEKKVGKIVISGRGGVYETLERINTNAMEQIYLHNGGDYLHFCLVAYIIGHFFQKLSETYMDRCQSRKDF